MARLDLDNHAIAAMTHAQNLEPSHAPGWFNLGSVQQRSDLIQEALASYKRAIEVDPAYQKAGEKMAALAQEHGRIETYMEAARLLLGMNADHEIREAYIAMLLQLAQGESDIMDQVAGLPPTLPAGPEMAQEALEFMDDTPSSQRALALSLSLQHSDAVLMWKSLIQQEPSEPNHWTGLARSSSRPVIWRRLQNAMPKRLLWAAPRQKLRQQPFCNLRRLRHTWQPSQWR